LLAPHRRPLTSMSAIAGIAGMCRRPKIDVEVESRMGAVAWGLWPTPRFPSPLIKPDVRISRIRLSDWLHREVHGENGRARLLLGTWLSFASRHSILRWLSSLNGVAGSSPITATSPSSKAHQKSGSFPPPALPGLIGPTTLSDSRSGRRLTRR
jgi:hypothetical protein